MSFVRDSGGQRGFDIAIPTEHAEDASWMEGANELLKEARSRYNNAVAGLRRGDIPQAIKDAEAAVELFPYAPLIIEFAIVLHLQHGSLLRACELIRHFAQIGDEDNTQAYLKEVRKRTDEWNANLDRPDLLRQEYLQSGRDGRYRELLLLQKDPSGDLPPVLRDLAQSSGILLHSGPTPSTVSNGAAVSPRWRWVAMALGLLLVGVVGGTTLTGRVTTSLSGNAQLENGVGIRMQPAERTIIESAKTSPAVQQFTRASRLFASADATLEAALAALDSVASEDVPAADIERLRRLIMADLQQRATTAWKERDYVQAKHLLGTLAVRGQIDHESYYRLGFAASEVCDTTSAVKALANSLSTGGRSRAYYEAEALYRLALLSEGTDSRMYAERLAEEYPNSIYNNSRIAKLLVP